MAGLMSTVRGTGITRYMAVALLTGYAWLAVAGVLWLDIGQMSFTDLGRAAHGTAYDAMLHAVFLGFVISMIFAHAPVIVPAVLLDLPDKNAVIRAQIPTALPLLAANIVLLYFLMNQ